jgi:hypothetical protein
MLPLWAALEPVGSHVRLMLAEPMAGTSLKARLPSQPAHDRAVLALLEALSLWYGLPLHAVIDADAEDVRRQPERWARWLGDPPEPHVRVEWMAVPRGRKNDRFLSTMGDFASARKLVSFTATGQR